MKFSFQMVVVAFVVTLAHLVVLATVSPITKETSRQSVKSESEPMEEEIESFPVVSEISLTATPEQAQEVTEAEVQEPEAVSVPRDERLDAPKAAELVEVSREESRPIPREESAPTTKSGPHEIRQISPKPRS